MRKYSPPEPVKRNCSTVVLLPGGDSGLEAAASPDGVCMDGPWPLVVDCVRAVTNGARANYRYRCTRGMRGLSTKRRDLDVLQRRQMLYSQSAPAIDKVHPGQLGLWPTASQTMPPSSNTPATVTASRREL